MELELRQLPEVLAVGIDQAGEQVTIHLLSTAVDPALIRRAAVQIAEGHVEESVIIDVAVAAPPEPVPLRLPRERVQLLTVRRPTRGEEVEVHLAFRGARTVGRGPFGTLSGTVGATVDALHGLGARVPFNLKTATRVGIGDDLAVLVVFSGVSAEDRMGIARASTVEESTCRATLHALNRFLSRSDAFDAPGAAAGAGTSGRN